MTHKDKIVNTLTKGYKCYGEVVKENDYCQSMPRRIPELRETLDTSIRDTKTGLIGILKYGEKSYKWYERMDGRVKLFFLEEMKEGQQSLFNRREVA